VKSPSIGSRTSLLARLSYKSDSADKVLFAFISARLWCDIGSASLPPALISEVMTDIAVGIGRWTESCWSRFSSSDEAVRLGASWVRVESAGESRRYEANAAFPGENDAIFSFSVASFELTRFEGYITSFA
jgi:hypothetical protein